MDKSARIRLIQEVREQVEALRWDDADLVLQEFGFGGMPESDGFGDSPTVTWTLQRGEDDDLVALASHFSVETSATSDLATPPTPASGPLLVFASHLSAQKRLVGEVETELARFGVSLFVAHTSIEPDQAWHDEIIKTLDTSHAGVAFLHDGFKDSAWCDQEVGWLLGRRVPVFSLMFDQPPYGPLGERQAINAHGLEAKDMASQILDVMFGRTELHSHLASSLVEGMVKSRGFHSTDLIWERLRELRNLDADQCASLMDAVDGNDQVASKKGSHPNSPWDGGQPYSTVIPAFIEKQPGAEPVRLRLDAWAVALQNN